MKIPMGSNTRVVAFNCPNCGAAVAPDSPSCSYCGSSIASLVCPACFGAVAIGMRHCPHCGAEAMESGPTQAGNLRCPRCETNLRPQTVGKNSMNICTKCGGLWVDKNVFQGICTREEDQEAVLAFSQESATPSAQGSAEKPKRAYIPCPECGKLMNHKNFSGSGIVLDWCRDHGSWFDRQELQQIVRFIHEGGLRKARQREQLRLKDQEDQLRYQEFTLSALERRLDPGFGEKGILQSKGDHLLDFVANMFLK